MSISLLTRAPLPVKLGVALGTALLAAACASSSTSSSPSAAASSPAASNAGASGAMVITTKSGPAGTYLTDGAGRTLYLWVADTGGKSVCSGACATYWPPVTAAGTVTASGGAQASDLGTFTRSDGSKQVTYSGHPLYYYAGDSGPGMTKGQGNNGFGAKWWLVAPSGASITAASAPAGGGY